MASMAATESRMAADARKKPPSTRRTAADGGMGHRTEKAPCPRGNIAQVKLKMEEPPSNTRLQPMGVTTSSILCCARRQGNATDS